MTANKGLTAAPFLKETIEVVRQLEVRFIELGRRLHRINAQHLWKGVYESYSDFLDEAKVTPSTASKLVNVYEQYIVVAGLTEEQLIGAPYSSLYEAIPLLQHESASKVLSKVKLLTRSEIHDEAREDKYPDCKHEETIVICSHCHKRVS